MGIKKLFDIISGSLILRLDDNWRLGVDGFSILFECLTPPYILTDKNGRVTHHIQALVQKIINLPKRQLWVFDPYKKNKAKTETLKERAKHTKEIFNKISLKQALQDLKDILDILGITYITAPDEVEAEGYLASLYKNDIIDIILSKDTDVLAYGAKLLYYKDKQYRIFDTKEICEDLGVKYNDFVKICCLLGNDFNPTANGISTKNVVNMVINNTSLSNKEIISYIIFREKIELVGIPTIKKWVVTEKLLEYLNQFQIEKIQTKLKTLII